MKQNNQKDPPLAINLTRMCKNLGLSDMISEAYRRPYYIQSFHKDVSIHVTPKAASQYLMNHCPDIDKTQLLP